MNRECIIAKITAVTLLILYVFSITACSLTIPAEQIEAVGYMNQKYGEVFRYETTEPVFLPGSEEAYILSSQKNPNERIMVRYDATTWLYGDNYTDILYKEQAANVAKDFVNRIFPGAPAATCLEKYRELEEKQISPFEEYMKINPPKLIAVVYYDSSADDLEELYRRIKDEIAASEYPLMKISIFLETDVQELSSFNQNAILNYREKSTYDMEITIDEMDFYSHNYK